HNQLAFARLRKHRLSVAQAAEFLNIDAVVNHPQLFRRKSVFRDQSITDGKGVRQDTMRTILDSPQPNAALAFVPIQVPKIASAGDDHWYAREPAGGNAQQIRPQIVRVNDVISTF